MKTKHFALTRERKVIKFSVQRERESGSIGGGGGGRGAEQK